MGKHFSSLYNEVDIENVIDDYKNGKKSCMDIALDYRVDYGTIRRVLLKNGVTLRKAGRQKTRLKQHNPAKRIDPNGNEWISIDKIKEGIKKYEDCGLFVLAAFWKCSEVNASKILKYHGINRHKAGWRPKTYIKKKGLSFREIQIAEFQ